MTNLLRSMTERGVSWPFAPGELYMNFGGLRYPLGLNQTLTGKREEIGGDFAGLVQGAYKSNGIVFACMVARLSLFSEARFMYRQLRSGVPGELFSLPSLDLLRNPWPGGTTGDLLARAITDADLAGNAFFVRRPGRIRRLRPDWVSMLYGSPSAEPSMWDPDAELIGYAYQPGGPEMAREPILYAPSEVAHFAPYPDPLAPHRGMSWLTPIIREIEADIAASTHKLQFFISGATVNLVVTGVPGASVQAYEEWVRGFKGKHEGVANAYKSLFLSAGMDAKAIGADMQQVDFKSVQGAGETRIAAAAAVPAVVLGISEGLAGSSLNSGNYASSFRRFADMFARPAWRNFCGSLETIMPPPTAAELWYDDRGIPALKDDIKDAAEVQSLNASAIRQLVDAGFEPKTVVDAVNTGDLKRLTHTGLFSVQLQPPMPEGPPEPEPVPPELAEPDEEDE